MHKNQFSIIMPAYNAEKTIASSINSVIGQLYKSWELIIVNDCSLDNTSNLINSFLPNIKIKVLELDKNHGVSKARNIALTKCTGEYIAFLDADDTWESNKLLEQKKVFDRGALIVFSSYRSIYQDNTSVINKVKEIARPRDFFKYNPIPNLTGSFHRSLMPVSQYDIGHEDYVMWYQLIKKAKVAISTPTNLMLASYRVNKNSLSSNKIMAAIWQWKILRIYFELNAIHAIYYFSFYVIRSLSARIRGALIRKT